MAARGTCIYLYCLCPRTPVRPQVRLLTLRERQAFIPEDVLAEVVGMRTPGAAAGAGAGAGAGPSSAAAEQAQPPATPVPASSVQQAPDAAAGNPANGKWLTGFSV